MTTFKACRLFPIVLCSAALLVAGCGKKPQEPEKALKSDDSILAFVPADTPYVFAAVEPLPDDVADKMEAQNDVVLKLYGGILEEFADEAVKERRESGDPDAGMDEASAAVLKEIAGLMSVEKLREAGIGRDGQAALYGVGLLPVVRLGLEDPDAFEKTIARIEGESGSEMTRGTAGGASYRYAGDDEARILLAVIDNYLVVAFVPTALSDGQVAAVLGVERPDSTIADSGSLSELAKTYDFTAHGLGYVDVQRIAATFVDEPSGVNAELLSMMEHDPAAVSAVCRTEAKEMAAVMPRFVAGYTKLTVDEFASNTVLELRSDIGKGLAALAAPVQGLGSDFGGLFSFGVGFDLQAARQFYEDRLDALAADPYECEWFAEFQAGMEQGRAALNQPLPPIAYGIKGFVAVVDNVEGLDFQTQQPPTDVDARVLVATENAPGLIAMGAMFSPEIAALDLKPDGKPVELALPPNPAGFQSAYVAVTDASLGISLGEGAESRLTELLAAPVADPSPIMSMNMDAARYYGLMGDTMTMDLPGMSDSPDGAEPSAEMMAAMGDVMNQIGDMMERMSVSFVFTERGLEMPSTVTLSD